MRTQIYTIPLKPIPWARAGHDGNHFYDKQKQEKLGLGLYLNKIHDAQPKWIGPLSLDVIFYLPVPKKKPTSQWCINLGDLDNYIKFLLDTITDCQLWDDDRIVCQIHAKKLYDTHPRTILNITELT